MALRIQALTHEIAAQEIPTRLGVVQKGAILGTDRVLATAKHRAKNRQNLQRPAMHRGMESFPIQV